MTTHNVYVIVCLIVLMIGMGARFMFPQDLLGHDLVIISVTALLTHGEWLRNQGKGE